MQMELPVPWWRVFDQRLHADVARQRTLRAFAAPPLRDARGARRRWPDDLHAIPTADVCAHAAYVREADNAELGDVVRERVDAFLRGRADGTVVEHDPRIAVRTVRAGPRPALIGQDGVFALEALAQHTVLCEYGGLVKTQRRHHAYVDQMEPTLQEQKTVVLNCTTDLDPDDGEPLVIDGSLGGTIGCKFNDCRLDPFTAPRRGTAPPLEAAPANCRFVEIILFDWPHVYLITTRDIAAGEELTIDYGETFWETVRLHEAIQTFTKVARGHAKFDVFVDVLSRL